MVAAKCLSKAAQKNFEKILPLLEILPAEAVASKAYTRNPGLKLCLH